MIYIRYSQFSIFIINNKNKQTKSFLKDKILIIKWTRLSKLEIEKFMFSTVNIHMCALSFSSIDLCSFSLIISCPPLGHQTNKYMKQIYGTKVLYHFRNSCRPNANIAEHACICTDKCPHSL